MNTHDFFPDISGPIPELNLNAEAKIYLRELGILDADGSWKSQNPLIQAEECERFIRWVHQKYNTQFSYGGYGEDRSILWHDTYLDDLNAYYHLGIDVNIPAGTPIYSPISGKVVLSDHDSDYPTAPQNHGWGNRLIIDPEHGDYLLILAHLSHSTKRDINAIIQKGEKLGMIGTSRENGGWFEHFHVQTITRVKFHDLLINSNLPTLDGYAINMDNVIKSTYPNPFETF